MPTDAVAGEGWRPPGEPLDPHWSGLPRGARVLLGVGLRAWTLSPWVTLACAGAGVGLHRWPGPVGTVGASLCILFALTGERLLWRSFVREVDVAVAATLLAVAVPDPAPWVLFPQREDQVKAAHWRRCLARHGVNPHSSGWHKLAATSSRRSWAALGVALLGCAPVSVWPWWL